MYSEEQLDEMIHRDETPTPASDALSRKPEETRERERPLWTNRNSIRL